MCHSPPSCGGDRLPEARRGQCSRSSGSPLLAVGPALVYHAVIPMRNSHARATPGPRGHRRAPRRQAGGGGAALAGSAGGPGCVAGAMKSCQIAGRDRAADDLGAALDVVHRDLGASGSRSTRTWRAAGRSRRTRRRRSPRRCRSCPRPDGRSRRRAPCRADDALERRRSRGRPRSAPAARARPGRASARARSPFGPRDALERLGVWRTPRGGEGRVRARHLERRHALRARA